MRNIKLILEYDGTRYCGWQKQKNGLSIQEVLQRSVENIVGHEIKIIGSSRTDAGVHAKGMVANFHTSSNIPIEKFAAAINSKLPHDIAVIDAKEVAETFHSRYDSKGKRYSYLIFNRKTRSPLYRNYAAQIPVHLDIQKMNEAASFILGTHDFSAFKASKSSVKNNIRTVKSIEVIKNGDIIKIQVEADGFLYNMVRIIAGTLIEVGMGKILPHDVKYIIESRDRKLAGKTAPPQGLYLECVYY